MPVHRRSSLAAAAPRPYAATIVFLLGFLGVLLLPSAAAGQDANVIDAFSRQIAADVEADGIGGITAAVFKGDQVLWSQGFGWADPENRVPAGVRTIYRTGSISKSVTAILMADLVEEGTVALDDAVVDHLPEVAGFGDPPADMAPITLRQLASHTAGLIREPELEGAAAGPIEDWGYKILASIPHTRYDTMPGARYQYSNIGYGVLGYALQRAAGTSFMDLVEDRLFEPLGRRTSTYIAGPALWRRAAVGYVNWDDGTVDPDLPALEHEGRGYKVPNGGVYATVGDLATFAAAVMGMTEHELLEPATRRDVMTVQTPEDPDAGYGLGFSIRPVALEGGDDVRFVGHGGSVAGYNMYLVFEPESGYGVALGRNYNRGATSLGEAGNGLLQALLEAGG
ncbi:MAG: beta-lactamase family protein [Gemmatimonadales bacterium]|nr:beta-lactamase family protein [Gemmatimonadales bacterium]